MVKLTGAYAAAIVHKGSMADKKGQIAVMAILLCGRARMTHEECPPAWCVRLNFIL